MEKEIEKEIEVEAYGVIKICEVCKKGEIFPLGKNQKTINLDEI